MNEKGKNCFWTFVKVIGIFVILYIVGNLLIGFIAMGALLGPSIGNTIEVISEASSNKHEPTSPPRPAPTKGAIPTKELTKYPRLKPTPECWFVPTLGADGQEGCVQGYVSDIKWTGEWGGQALTCDWDPYKEKERCKEVPPGSPNYRDLKPIGPGYYAIGIQQYYAVDLDSELMSSFVQVGRCLRFYGTVRVFDVEGKPYAVLETNGVADCR